jgi:PAS domain S-box-containing protein
MLNKKNQESFEQLLQENKELKDRLSEAEETLRKRSDSDVLKSKRLLNTVLDNVNSGVALIDEAGSFAVVNPLFLKLFGLSEDATIKNVNDQNWAAWQVFNEHGRLLHVDDHPVRKAVLTGKRVDQQLIGLILPSGGDIVWLLVSAEPLYKDNGDIENIICTYTDITRLKNADQLLKQSLSARKLAEESLIFQSQLLANVNDAVFSSDLNFTITYWNKAAEKMFGWKKEEALGKNSGELLKPNIDGTSPDKERAKLRREGHWEGETKYFRKDGTYLFAEVKSAVLTDENGTDTGNVVVTRDITERKKVEEKLRESENRFRNLVKKAPTAIFEVDLNSRKFISVNDALCEISGFSKEELLSLDILELLADEDKERFISRISEINEGNIIEEKVEYKVKAKDGHTIDSVLSMKFDFDEHGIAVSAMVVGHDITERRLAEENLKESEKKLKSVLNATLESIYMFDTKGYICMTNITGMNRLKKNSESEVIGHHYSEFMTPEIAESRHKMHQKVISLAKPLEFEDERDHRTYHHSFSPVLIDDKVQFVVTYSTDITERKNSELKLKQSEDRLRSIAESLTVMISITRMKDSIVVFANEPYLKAFGFNHWEVIGKKDPDIFVNPDDRINIHDILKESEFLDNREMKVKRSDGKSFWIIVSIRKISYMGETSFIASSIDITETKKTQEEFIRLNRTLNAHSKSSQAMMHSTNEISYLNEVCKIIIEDCGHSMVWVGYAQNDTEKTVLPVAYYGFDKGYIDQMKITWDDSVYGRGPTGTAIKTGRPSICKNMLTDPRFAPWKEAAIARGYSSSLVLPLRSEGRSFGAVSIYSKEPDSFSDSEIDLLNDLVDDLAHGISYIRLEESERAAAKVIKESEAKLKELIVTKDKFFNIVAHDLKNPFTSLLGSSELLYDNISQMTTENVRKLALILNDSAKSGYAILQNLLDWSRSQTGMIRFCPTEINLRLIIDENIDNLALQTSNKGITMWSDLKTDLFMTADKNMINTVLRNLLSNSVKFSHKNGEVRIIITKKHDEAIICVIDSGIGMPQDKINQLFKLENSLSMPGTEKEQGTGLGLKLCKEFTELMGGRIWVESEPGKGSKFSFTIPVNGGTKRPVD